MSKRYEGRNLAYDEPVFVVALPPRFRAPDYKSGGQEFESLRARHLVLICEPGSLAVCPARTARSSSSLLPLMRMWWSSSSTVSISDCKWAFRNGTDPIVNFS